MQSISRRRFLTGGASAALISPTPPTPALAAKRATKQPARPQVVNDASRLNPVPVALNFIVRSADQQRVITDLRALLNEAARENRPVCIGGARHSMGGQSLVRDGFNGTFATPSCVADIPTRSYRAASGTRWRDVIAALDPLGYSVAVMQSNHDFSVGGTLSVNAHGWPVPFGPFGTSVLSFRLMLGDGTILTCTRNLNRELFALVIGGYGLFGIVIDADLAMVENISLLPRFTLLPARAVGERFPAEVHDPSVKMAYARLSVARENFLEHALLVTFHHAPRRGPLPSARNSKAYAAVSRSIFRQQVGSERGKAARWYAETVLQPRVATRQITRNAILNYPVSALADTNPRRTDILHEYFLAPARFGEFLAACRELIPPSKQDLLNVTLRYVDADPVSVLNYAPAPRIAAVLLFTQGVEAEDDLAMQALTQALIDRVLALGGSFYLPYRLHARPDQLRAAYPRLDEFIARKRHYDPQARFRNLMWDKYFS